MFLFASDFITLFDYSRPWLTATWKAGFSLVRTTTGVSAWPLLALWLRFSVYRYRCKTYFQTTSLSFRAGGGGSFPGTPSLGALPPELDCWFIIMLKRIFLFKNYYVERVVFRKLLPLKIVVQDCENCQTEHSSVLLKLYCRLLF